MLNVLYIWLRLHVRSERGQDLIEYAMLSGLIALGLIAVGAFAFSGPIGDMAAGVGNCIDFKKSTTCSPF